MKKMMMAGLALATISPAFAAWNTVSYNLNEIAITGANFTDNSGTIRVTWQGYIANNRNVSTYRVKIYDLTLGGGAPIYVTDFATYSSATNYSYTYYVAAGHYYNASLYAVSNQAVGTNPPATHVTNWCWIYN